MSKRRARPGKPRHAVNVDGRTYRWDSDDDQEMDRLLEEWAERDWLAWIKEHLRFPFQVRRKDDDDNACFTEGVAGRPFRLGSAMTVTGLSRHQDDLDFDGVLVDAVCGKEEGVVPLQDL